MIIENVGLRCLLTLQKSKSSFPIAKDLLCNHWQLILSPPVPILPPLIL